MKFSYNAATMNGVTTLTKNHSPVDFIYEGKDLTCMSRGYAYLILSPRSNLNDLTNVYVVGLSRGRWWPSTDNSPITFSENVRSNGRALLGFINPALGTPTLNMGNSIIEIPNGKYYVFIAICAMNTKKNYTADVAILTEKTGKIITVEGSSSSLSQFQIIQTFRKAINNQARQVDGFLAPIVNVAHMNDGYLNFDIHMTNNSSTTNAYVKLYISNDNYLDNYDYYLGSVYTQIPNSTNKYSYKIFASYGIPFNGAVNTIVEISKNPHQDTKPGSPLTKRTGSNIDILGYYYFKNSTLKSNYITSESGLSLPSEQKNIVDDINVSLINNNSEIKINIPYEYIGGNVIISGINNLNSRQIKLQNTETIIPNYWKFTDKFIVVRVAFKENVKSFKFAN